MSKVILPAQTLRPERGVTVSLPKDTAKSFADDLMDAANVPTLYHDRLRPLLEARLDPADKPRYAELLVRVGQPCIRDLVRATFEDLEAKLAYAEEQTETPEMLAARNSKRTSGPKDTVVRREKVAVLSRGTLTDPQMLAATPVCTTYLLIIITKP